MELDTFARFHAHPGNEAAMIAALEDVHAGTVHEPGCVSHHAYQSTRNPRLFYIHSTWKDEAAFEIHANLPHTVRFLETVERLIDHEVEVIRTNRIA